MIKVWFPEFYTEAHREDHHRQTLAHALREEGVEPQLVPDGNTRLVFVGGFLRHHQYRDQLTVYRHLPSVWYCWDLYPWKVEGTGDKTSDNYERVSRAWLHEWMRDADRAAAIVVPSRCTADRVCRYLAEGIPVHTVKAPVHLWERPPGRPSPREIYGQLLRPGRYAVDVMRKYEDPFADACRQACDRAGVPCLEMNHGLGWDDFRWAVANAGLLVSAVSEASTGGLTLLEGYAHGVPVLMSDSRWHGGRDYFGDQAGVGYFRWDDPADLAAAITRGMTSPRPDPAEARRWVAEEYSERRFARQLAGVFREVLGV